MNWKVVISSHGKKKLMKGFHRSNKGSHTSEEHENIFVGIDSSSSTELSL